MRRRHWWFALLPILLYVLLGVSLATVVITGRFWWQQQANRPTGGGATPEALKEKLEAYDKRADELERLLTLLLGLSTIYAIALGLSAYQQLKDSTDKLEKLTDKAEEKIQGFADKVVTKFPLFADMDIAIGMIMDHLMRSLPVIDWSDADYRKLKDQEKQEILFYEKTVASFEYFDLRRTPNVRETTSEIYHGLGNFYGLKYVSEGKKHTDDRERSRFYLERAIDHDTGNTGALNDRAFLAVYLDDPPDNPKAKTLFSGCSPLSRNGPLAATRCFLTRFAALRQFFARVYTALRVR